MSFHFLIALYIIVGMVGYFLTTEFNAVSTLWVLWVGGGCTYTLTVIPFLTYLYSENFQKVLNFIGNQRFTTHNIRKRRVHSNPCIQRSDPSRKVVFSVKLALCVYLTHIGTTVLDIVFFCSKDVPFYDVQHYTFGFPFMDRIVSFRVFWTCFAFQCIIGVFPVIIAVSEVTFVIVMATEFNNIVVDYCGRMQHLSEILVAKMEKNRMSTVPEQISSVELLSVFRIFEQNLKIFIRQYLEFFRLVGLTTALSSVIFGVF